MTVIPKIMCPVLWAIQPKECRDEQQMLDGSSQQSDVHKKAA